MQRYVSDTALIEPFNSFQILLTTSFRSNMYLTENPLARAVIWRWRTQNRSISMFGACSMFRGNRFIWIIFCGEASKAPFISIWRLEQLNQADGILGAGFVPFQYWDDESHSFGIFAMWAFRRVIGSGSCNTDVNYQCSDCRTRRFGCAHATDDYYDGEHWTLSNRRW